MRWRVTIITLTWLELCLPLVALGQTVSTMTIPTTVIGGNAVTGKLSISAVAPAGGLVFKLQSSHPVVASIPVAVTVPEGASSTSFELSTVPVQQNTAVAITATSSTSSIRGQLTVVAPTATHIGLAPGALVGGRTSTATLQLNGPAPEGMTIQLSSSEPAVASVPASIVMKPGQTTASFAVVTLPVAQTTPVRITAAANGESRTTELNVSAPTPFLTLPQGGVLGGASLTVTVTLNGATPSGGLIVQLQSSNTSVALVPPSITIEPAKTLATFVAATVPVAQLASVTITATGGAGSTTRSMEVRPPGLIGFTLVPDRATGGRAAHGIVTINGLAPSTGFSLAIASDNPAVATVPSSVEIRAGSVTQNFPITTVPVAQSTPALITVRDARGNLRSLVVNVVPPAPSHIELGQAVLVGGRSTTGVVNLTGAAPASGLQIQMTSSAPSAGVPASVPVTAGTSSANFQIITAPVAQPTIATITASLSDTTRTTQLTILPAALNSFTLASGTISPFQSTTASLNLTGPAPATGLVVQLSTSHPGMLVVPASVTVPSGETTATFAIGVIQVTQTTNVTLTATAGSVTRTATITVRPSGG